MRVKLIYLLFALLLAYNSTLAKNRHYHGKQDFDYLSIGPGIGGSVFLSELSLAKDRIYVEYFLGGKIIMKPNQPIGIETGYYLHRGSEDYRYFSTPLILSYTDKKKITFQAGIIFLFNKIENNQVNYKDPEYGGIFIVGNEKLAVGLLIYPPLPFFSDPELQFDNFIIGFKIESNILFSLF